jgi:phytanoyl-CoA hydroxylase
LKEHLILPSDGSQRGVAEEFLERGYLILPDMLSRDEIRELELDIYKVATGGYACEHFRSLPATLSEDEIKSRVLSIHEAHLISPVIAKYVQHPAIAAVLAQIVGAHLHGWTREVKCLQTMYYAKPPNMAGHPWHQDEAFFPTRDRSLTAVYIAIDDIDAENGSLWFIPASHKDGYMYPRRPHGNESEYLFEIGCAAFPEEKMVPVEMKALTVSNASRWEKR